MLEEKFDKYWFDNDISSTIWFYEFFQITVAHKIWLNCFLIYLQRMAFDFHSKFCPISIMKFFKSKFYFDRHFGKVILNKLFWREISEKIFGTNLSLGKRKINYKMNLYFPLTYTNFLRNLLRKLCQNFMINFYLEAFTFWHLTHVFENSLHIIFIKMSAILHKVVL